MGWETANIHLGSPDAIKAVAKRPEKRPAGWLLSAVEAMTEATERDWKEWKKVTAETPPLSRSLTLRSVCEQSRGAVSKPGSNGVIPLLRRARLSHRFAGPGGALKAVFCPRSGQPASSPSSEGVYSIAPKTPRNVLPKSR